MYIYIYMWGLGYTTRFVSLLNYLTIYLLADLSRRDISTDCFVEVQFSFIDLLALIFRWLVGMTRSGLASGNHFHTGMAPNICNAMQS